MMKNKYINIIFGGRKMACDYCTDLKIFYEQFTTWERKTYVCYIDGHSARTPDELEDTCPYLELE